jgi:hypothetical protein
MSSSYHALILIIYSHIIITLLSEHGWSFNTQLPRTWDNDDDVNAEDQDAPVHYNCILWELESDWLYLNLIYLVLSFLIDLSIPTFLLCPNYLGFLNTNSAIQQYYYTSHNHNCVLPLFS